MNDIPGVPPASSDGLNRGYRTHMPRHRARQLLGPGCRIGRGQHHRQRPTKEGWLTTTESSCATTKTETWPGPIFPTTSTAYPTSIIRTKRAATSDGIHRHRSSPSTTDDRGLAGAHSAGEAPEPRQALEAGSGPRSGFPRGQENDMTPGNEELLTRITAPLAGLTENP